MKKRIAVTGANGFVGNYVTESLLRDGAEVLAINGPGIEIKNKNVKNCYADILNIDDIKAAFKDFQPDSIIHLAAIAAPTFKMAKTAHIGWTNAWIPILGALLIWMLGVSPVYVIAAAAIGGYLYGKFIHTTADL